MTRRIIVDGQSMALIGDDWPEDDTAAAEAVRAQETYVSKLLDLIEEYGEPYDG